MQAEELTKAPDDGLEKTQDVSVGRKPVPLTDISKPTCALPELNISKGCALPSDTSIPAQVTTSAQTRIETRTNLTVTLTTSGK